MSMRMITSPLIEPVTMGDVRSFLRLAENGEEETLTRLIKTAREMLEQRCGMALIEQCWSLQLHNWPVSDRIALYKYPLRSVDRIYSQGWDGGNVELNPADWQLNSINRPARITINRPQNINPARSLTVEFTAGFGSEAQDVPKAVQQAMLTLIAHLYEFRGGSDAQSRPVTFPPVVDQLVAPWNRRGQL